MDGKTLKAKLNILYFVLFGSMACYYPFLTVYFQQKGLSYSQIGVLYAANSLVAVISQPAWGIITDKYFNKRYTLLLTMTASAVFVLLFVSAKGFGLVLLAIILFMMFQSPIISINDAYCYEIMDVNKDIQYGKIRLMGSVGFAIVVLALGGIIKITKINSMFFAYIILIISAAAILRSIKFKGKKMRSSINMDDILGMFKNRKFVLLTLSAMIVCTTQGANGSYLAILIQKTGGDVSNLGMLWFIIAMSELPAFFFGSKILKRVGVINIYLISLIFYSVRFFMDSICSVYQAVLVLQMLQTITYPLYFLATLQYINETMPSRMRTSAITAFTAITAGTGGLIGNIGGGFILQNLGVFYLFRIMAITCIIALLPGVILKNDERIKV